jgi:hypothetical protein
VRWLSRISVLFVAAVLCGFAYTSAADAANATWSGVDSTPSWSSGLNWSGGSAPGVAIGTLTFPDLGTTCDDAQGGAGPTTSDTCYGVEDDAGQVDVNQIVVDDDTGYAISPAATGDEIQLAGAPASVAGTTENVGLMAIFGSFGSNPYPYCCTYIGVPVALSADQVWELDGGSDELQIQTEVDEVSGTSSTLGLDFTNGGVLDVTSLNTGAATLTGDGAVYVELKPNPPFDAGPTLPSSGVTVTNGAALQIGAPDTTSGPIDVSSGSNATLALINSNSGTADDVLNGTLDVTGNITLGSGTNLNMDIYGPADSGSTPTVAHDFSQITASGTISLGDAQLGLDQSNLNGGTCLDLVPGQVYPLIEAGAVTGELDDGGSPIANGQTITLSDSCDQLQPGNDATVRINYTQTSVTATVVSGGHAGDVPGSGSATITGTPQVGSPLQVVNSDWTGSPTSYDYVWSSCPAVGDCVSVGSDAPEYTPVASDAGNTIWVQVTANNSYGQSVSTANAVTTDAVTLPPAPLNDSAPTISGNPTVADALTATPGSWDGSPAIAYQWELCTTQAGTSCTDIHGATSSSYTLTGADIGQYVRVAVTGTNPGGTTVAYSATSGAVNAAASAPPVTATSPAVPDSSQVQAALNTLTHPSGKKEIGDLLKAGSFATSFKAPDGGSLTIVWTASLTTGSSKKKAHKTITIATGNAQPTAAATATITIHLTRAGKALLNQKHTSIAATATEEFRPTGGSWTSTTKKFNL